MAMGVVVVASSLVTVAYFIGSLIYRRRTMSGSGIKSLHMRIGYYLYSNTRLGLWFFNRELRKSQSKLNGQPHSTVEAWKRNGVAIYPLPMSADNYSYAIVDESSRAAVLIDPADAEYIQNFLSLNNISPVAVLTTHKHWDHSAGNEPLRKRYRGLEVHGSELEHVPSVTHTVSDGDVLSFGQLTFTAHHTPGHTAGHMVYVLDGSTFQSPDSIFSGDLLFVGGAGRLFEGDACTMLKSLDRLCQFPDDTLIWPGHEYSLTNLQFAASLEPNNPNVINKLRDVIERRTKRQSTCPSTLAAERTFNPFLRVDDDALLTALQLKTSVSDAALRNQLRVVAFAECRARKDVFKARRQ